MATRKKQRGRILLVGVHYRNASSMLELLASLSVLRFVSDLTIRIVDNSSADEHPAEMRGTITQYPNAELVETSTNRGYFGAARLAFDQYLVEEHDLPDWVIVCNHDVLIEDRDFFGKLLREDPETVGVLAPRIQVWPGNLDQNPFMRRRPGRLRWAQLRFVSSKYPLAAFWYWLWRRKAELRSWLAERRRTSPPNSVAKREPIYAAHGSFFIFSRRYFEAGGYLDGNLFLYGEEISVAEICRSLGLPVVYEPSLRVIHREHQSTGKVLNRFTYECQKKALQYLTSRYLSGSEMPAGSCQPDVPQ
jgi:GT2 family glycosyltransferase